MADRGGCRGPDVAWGPTTGPIIGGARQGGTHNAEILRAGAGAPRGLRRRDHNAEAERTTGISERLSLATPEAPPSFPLFPRHLAVFIDMFVT